MTPLPVRRVRVDADGTGYDMQAQIRHASVRRVYLIVSVLTLSVVAATGCITTQAAVKPTDRPPLVVPPPPARIIEPAPVDTTPEPVNDLPPPPTTGSTTPPRRAAREATPKPAATDTKVAEAKPGEVKPVDPPPVEPPPVANPSTQLRTPQTADTSGAAKNIRTTIDAAQGLLNGVSYQPLSNARKKAYNDAKLLMQQAEDALKQGNLVFAEGVANKAEKLAKELAGR